ncbi:MAG: monooxygenase [Blastochloris sp.]|nr:monooxygenase [Blastochloris sp.]
MSQPHASAALKEAFTFNHTPSNRCGCTLSASQEGNAIARMMSRKEGVEVTYYPALIRIDGYRMLEFDCNEIAEELGLAEDQEYGPYQFEIEMSTHYGRMVRLDDKVLFFANPEDAAEYLGFEQEAVEAH